jgi:hypothetical protein
MKNITTTCCVYISKMSSAISVQNAKFSLTRKTIETKKPLEMSFWGRFSNPTNAPISQHIKASVASVIDTVDIIEHETFLSWVKLTVF